MGFGHVFTALLHTSHSACGSLLLAMKYKGFLEARHLASKKSRNWLPKRVSLLTLAAIAKIRISLLLSFLRYFQRERIACPIKQWKSTEFVPTDCLLRVATAEMVNELRVSNNLFLMFVDEQMSDARGSPSYPLRALLRHLLGKSSHPVFSGITVWRCLRHVALKRIRYLLCADYSLPLTFWVFLEAFFWRRHHEILCLQLFFQLCLLVFQVLSNLLLLNFSVM